MIGRSHLFRRVTIVGIGLMGGSLGLAIKKYGLAREVIGLSQSQSSLMEAEKMGAIDKGMTDIKKAVQNVDLVVLATPVDDIIKLFDMINPYLRRGTIVTDVGSTKTEILDAAQKTLNFSYNFVGSHPLVGSEKKGVESARADLFEGAICIMTWHAKTSNQAKERVKQLWAKVGASVKSLSPEEHDETLAYISHVPHLIAYALLDSIPAKYLPLASGGLKDTTRIAGSSPQVWKDISLSNSKNMVKALDEFVQRLKLLRQAMAERDEKILLDMFTKAKEKRDSITHG